MLCPKIPFGTASSCIVTSVRLSVLRMSLGPKLLPRCRRKRDTSPERIEELEAQLQDANPIQRLSLLQTIRDLEAEAAAEDDPRQAEVIGRDFVRQAKAYSQAKGIEYATWREAGVPA